MLSQSILLTTLLGAPPTSSTTEVAPPDFAERLERVEVTVSDTDAVIDALDVEGEPIGSLALWVDESGITWIATDYADGSALIGISANYTEVYREATLPPHVIAERADVLLGYFDEEPYAAKHSWGECAWKAGFAVGACWTLRPIGCAFGAIKAGCACVPKLVKEFEEYECPWDL